MNDQDLRELYQEVIINHNKHPRNKGISEHCTHQAEGDNPICGDRVTVQLNVNDDTIEKITFDGDGCAISVASASIMTSLLKGKSLPYAQKLSTDFQAICTRKALDETLTAPELEELNLLTSVKHFPARVKCATLAWHTLDSALEALPSLVSCHSTNADRLCDNLESVCQV